VKDPEFHTGLARVLVPGGEFLLKTDSAEYHEAAVDAFAQLPEFEPLPWPEDAFFYPLTDFEQHWLQEGRTIHRKRWRLSPPASA
jgi:tRNA (guanine-N7-)-methyltransferase